MMEPLAALMDPHALGDSSLERRNTERMVGRLKARGCYEVVGALLVAHRAGVRGDDATKDWSLGDLVRGKALSAAALADLRAISIAADDPGNASRPGGVLARACESVEGLLGTVRGYLLRRREYGLYLDFAARFAPRWRRRVVYVASDVVPLVGVVVFEDDPVVVLILAIRRALGQALLCPVFPPLSAVRLVAADGLRHGLEASSGTAAASRCPGASIVDVDARVDDLLGGHRERFVVAVLDPSFAVPVAWDWAPERDDERGPGGGLRFPPPDEENATAKRARYDAPAPVTPDASQFPAFDAGPAYDDDDDDDAADLFLPENAVSFDDAAALSEILSDPTG